MRKAVLIVLFLFSQFIPVKAEADFTVSVSRNPVSAGEQFQVSFALNGDGRNFRPPSFKGLSVLSGPSQSTNMQIINGNFSRKLTFSYVLMADKPGEYVIGPATIRSGGKKLTSNTVKLKVVKGSAARGQKQDGQSIDQQAQDIIRKNLYIKASVSKTNIYRGQQIVATYKLYAHPELSLLNNSMSKNPVFNGFWKNEIDYSNKKWATERVGGVNFRTVVLKKVLLLPQRSGKLKIDPMEMEFDVRLAVQNNRRRRDIFDDFFGRGSYKDFKYTAKSRAVTINVKPLPEDAPPSFYGAVGKLNMEAWLDRGQTVINDPVTLKIKISGKGNLKLLDPPDIEFPPGIESYDPKTADNISSKQTQMSGNVIFEYLLIPRNAGEYKINPIEFTYFDLDKKNYVTQTSETFIIKVAKGDGGEAGTIVTGVNKEAIQYLGKDIRFIKGGPVLFAKGNEMLFGSFTFWSLLCSPVVLFLFLLLWKKRTEELNKNQVLLRTRQATKLARKRLAAAKSNMNGKSSDKFHDEITKGLWGYLADKLAIPAADLTKDSVRAVLNEKGIEEAKIERFLRVIDESEFARYSQSSGESAERSRIYNDAVEAIGDLEGHLR